MLRWNRLVLLFLIIIRLKVGLAQTTTMRAKQHLLGGEIKSRIESDVNERLLKSILLKSNDGALRNASYVVANLASFQVDLIRKRNAECIFDKHHRFEWSEVKLESFNRSVLSSSLTIENDNLTNLIFDELNNKCIDVSSLVDLFVNNMTNYREFETLLRIIMSQSINSGCDMCHETETSSSISPKETWVYGILFVSLINLSSLCGVFIIPLSNRKFYKKTLMFLIAIAVGSLAGSGFLHLIPQAFAITEDSKYSINHRYVWKAVVMMGGVYLFYVVEKIMKLLIQRKKILRKESTDNQQIAPYYNSQILESMGYLKTHEPNLEPNIEMRIKNLLNMQEVKNEVKNKHHGHTHDFGGGNKDFYSIAPVAWMIIFGDGLHNFIDGLSIGAAFTESVLKGISICLAVMCEEFPHELGDFAILINAGMSYPVALLFNFLSACCCYAGLVVGISLGENFGANEWIYAIAGGMFLYISLCDMIPELNEMGEEIERDYANEMAMQAAKTSSPSTSSSKNQKKSPKNQSELVVVDVVDDECQKPLSRSDEDSPSRQAPDTVTARAIKADSTESNVGFKIKILIIQNIGIVCGFSFMLFMAIHSESITFS